MDKNIRRDIKNIKRNEISEGISEDFCSTNSANLCSAKMNLRTTTGIMFGILMGIFLFAVLAAGAEAMSYTVNPTKDSYVSAAMPNTNYGTQIQLKVRSNLLYPRRALLEFADMPSVPPQYQINSAKLRIYVEAAPWGVRTYNAERILSEWSETAVNWKNQPMTAGISAGTPLSSAGWLEFDVTSDVRAFYNGSYTNRGWKIVDSNENGIFTQEALILSREASDPLHRPQLVINYCVDFDGDGYFRSDLGCPEPFDCDDTNAAIHPNAAEICNNADDNCNSEIDENVSEIQNCGTDVGECEYGQMERNCAAGVWGSWSECTGGKGPSEEVCNNRDDDCDSEIDEALSRQYGSTNVGECEYGIETCAAGIWSITMPAVEPADELCDNKDNDCDGSTDEDLARECYTGPEATLNVGICRAGTQTCSAGVWSACAGQILPRQEICENGIDENCNGRDEPCFDAVCVATDIPDTVIAGNRFNASVTMRNDGEDRWTQFYGYKLGSQNPQDNTLWGISRVEIASGASIEQGQQYTFNFELTAPWESGTYTCDWQMVQEYVKWFGETCRKSIRVVYDCLDNDDDSHYGTSPSCPFPTGDDADDSDPTVYYGAPELCDSKDNNQNSIVDEGCPDRDSECIAISAPDSMLANSQQQVSVTMRNRGTYSWISPYYKLGSQKPQDNTLWGISRVELAESAVVKTGDDYTFTFNITAPNTSGSYNFSWKMVREGVTWFGAGCTKIINVGYDCIDADMDGYYAAGSPGCPSGNDCDDSNPQVNPGMREDCLTGYDDNCNGNTNDRNALNCTNYYYDSDRDEFGNATFRCYCRPTGKYSALADGDCNDADANINPGMTEICYNGIDDNCDLLYDAENAVNCQIFYRDDDGDAFGATDNKCYCYAHNPYNATADGDCNDADNSVSPGATESCNGKDDDCDSQTDEENAVGCTQYYYDNDADNFGTADSKCLCSPSGKYTALVDGDCNDNNIQIYPGATELCNELDDDCDIEVDEGCPWMDAKCAGMGVPNGILKNSTKTVSVTMKNTGRANWTRVADFNLGSVGDDATWGITRAYLAPDAIVYTGRNYTFTFDITAPSITGEKNFEWKMLKESVEWFGESCKKSIHVVDMPDVTYVFSPAVPDGNNGWYKTRPGINLSVNSTYNPTAKPYYRWDSGTEYLFASEITAPEGIHTLYFRGKDSYGNIGVTYEEEFKVDSQAPKIRAFRPNDGSTIRDTMPHIWARYDEYGSSGIDGSKSFLEIRYPNGTIENVSASFSNYYMDYYPATPLADGLHILNLGVADLAGNFALQTWKFTVDTTPPNITIYSPQNDGNYTTKTILLNVSTDETVTRIERKLNSGRFSELCRYCNSFTGTLGVAEGLNVLVIRAADSIGNQREESVAFTVTTP